MVDEGQALVRRHVPDHVQTVKYQGHALRADWLTTESGMIGTTTW